MAPDTYVLRADQQLSRNCTTEMAARAEREELDGQKKERSQVKVDSDQSSILLFGTPGYEEGGRGPFPPNHPWSPVSGGHVLAQEQLGSR